MSLNVGVIKKANGKYAVTTTFETKEEFQAWFNEAEEKDGDEKVAHFLKLDGVPAEILQALVGTVLNRDLDTFLSKLINFDQNS